MLMDMCLHKFEIYQGAVAPKSFKSHTNSWCPDIARPPPPPPHPQTLKKKKDFVKSNARLEIQLVQSNIVSIGQSVRS